MLLILLALAGNYWWTKINKAKSPPSNTQIEKTYTIIAAGDIACDPEDKNFNDLSGSIDNCQMKATANLALAAAPTAVLALGDLQYEDGAYHKFSKSYDPTWGRLKAVTRPALGNHEYGKSGAEPYFDYFNEPGNTQGPAGERGKGYYSFDIGNWHLVALNSNCDAASGCGAGSTQYEWLKQDLAKSDSQCTLAFWHHPRFTSGNYQATPAINTTPFWELLHQDGADLILNGHDHIYERFARQAPTGSASPDGVRQLTVGTGGRSHYKIKKLTPNSEKTLADDFGVLKLILRNNGYDWEFIGLDGQVLDNGFDHC